MAFLRAREERMLPDEELICVPFLTEAERELILTVLLRDKKLRRAEEQRVRRLKAELLNIKKKGAKSGSRTYSNRSCARCQEPLSPLGVNYCQGCNHQVCCKCRAVRPNGFWVCKVCAKEVDLKMSTGDWFYDQRVNRFLNSPGHNLVGVSLRKRPPVKKRETFGEVLLQSSEMRHSQPTPFHQPRQKNPLDVIKGTLSKASGPPEHGMEQPGDVKASLSSHRIDTETSVTLGKDEPEAGATGRFSSQESTQAVLAKESHTCSSISDPTYILHHVKPCSGIIFEDEGLFKNSTRRAKLPAEYSTEVPGGSMGDGRKSVPELSLQEEEEEDIDNLVKFHRMAAHGSDFSLHSSMSKSSLDSMTSIYSGVEDYNSVEVSGDIVFSLGYDKRARSLFVFIKECHNLAYGDTARQRSNPYVKCYLLPDKSRQNKKKTAIKRNAVNPAYNETLKFSISRSQLLMRTLLLSVWHYDFLGRNVFLGEAELPMDCKDLDSAHEECVALRGKVIPHPKSSAFTPYNGQLVVSLKYVTTDKTSAGNTRVPFSLRKKSGGGELHVLIKEARDLTPMKAGGASDTFVKGYLLPAKTRATKRKTPVVRMTLNPLYDHTFVYKDLSVEQLQGMCLELTVWDHEAMSSNAFLGGIQLNSGTAKWPGSTEEMSLWQKMMQYPNSWAEGTLLLCSSMSQSK